MDVRRNIGIMTILTLFAKENNVTIVNLDTIELTFSRIISEILHYNYYTKRKDAINVKLLFPVRYGIKPKHGLLTEKQISDINKIDKLIIIEKEDDS